jgi:AAA domain
MNVVTQHQTILAEAFQSCLRIIAGAEAGKEQHIFAEWSRHAMRHAMKGGCDKVESVDRLYQAGLAIGLKVDFLQTQLRDAVEFSESVDLPTPAEVLPPTPFAGDLRRDRVTSVDLQDFLARTYPPRASMLSPWLPMQGLAMAHGYRGFGKTLMAHGSSWAIATGGGFWRWKAPQPRRVLVIDGEMPAADLQSRLRNIQENSELRPDVGFFRIAAADTFREGLPDLSNQSMQGFYSDVVADADFILLDNISTLCPGAQENDADGWAVMQVDPAATPSGQERSACASRWQRRPTARNLEKGRRSGHRDLAASAARLHR